ncbi:MAG: YfjI family protein [Paracoccus sp. (in: a-proteobacteria)]|nr:YfjI family protein [Paracoccus sp. (in: a-proteobacteria)]
MDAMPEPIPFKTEGPQPLLRPIPPGKPYPVEALGPLQAAVEAVTDKSQAPAGLAAQSALAIASLAVQPHGDVETLAGDVPLSLFCLTIAESGERKSYCDRLLMEGLRSIERDRAREYADEKGEHDVRHKVWSEKRKRLIAEAAGAKKEKAVAAEADLRAMGPEPRAPLLPNLTTAEPTFPGLVKLYQAGSPSLGLFSDDAGGFIGGHAMNADNRLATVAGLSRLWNGDALDRTRAGDGAAMMPGRRLAMHLMAQAVAVYPLLNDPIASGQGFLARFLATEPPSHIGTRTQRGYDAESDAVLDAFASRLGAILTAPMPTGEHEQELAPPRLPLSPTAKELLWRFYVAVEQAQAPGQEFERQRATASKAAEQAARIAGVLTKWDDLHAPEVPPDMMVCGVELATYYLHEAKRLSDAGAVSAEMLQAEKLRCWLLDSWTNPEITPREILRFGPGSMRDSKTVAAMAQVLERAGWLVPMPEGIEIRGAARKLAWRIAKGGSHVL